MKYTQIHAHGFALIEVLIAVFVLAIGILGAGAIQTIGLQANQGAYVRSQAMFLASDIVDRIRANRSALSTYAGVDTSTTTAPTLPTCISSSSGCSAVDVATADISDWIAKIKSGIYLPGANGKVVSLGSGDNVQVTITWGETDWKAGVRNSVDMSYVVTAAINPGMQ